MLSDLLWSGVGNERKIHVVYRNMVSLSKGRGKARSKRSESLNVLDEKIVVVVSS